MSQHSHSDDLCVRFAADGKTATLTADLCFSFFGEHVIVPKSFITDFASIPRVLRRLLPKMDSHIRAAVLHDWLYLTGLDPRWIADRAFLEVMRQHGTPAWKRYPMYWGVRAGGWYAWNKYRKASV